MFKVFWISEEDAYFKGLTEDMTARVSFTNHAGRVIDEDLGEHDGNRFVIDQLVVADARQKITVTVYNADGGVYSTYIDSLESYTARARVAQAKGVELYEEIMNFADSAKVYLENKN